MGLFLIGYWVLKYYLTLPSEPKTAADSRSDFRVTVDSVLRTNLTENFKDPYSVKFSDAVLYRDQAGEDDLAGHYSLCGKVNAKNGFGAYVGSEGFVSSAWFKKGSAPNNPLTQGQTLVMENSDGPDASTVYAAAVAVFCKNADEQHQEEPKDK